jgi:two-component system chemotaxis response regulator CheB
MHMSSRPDIVAVGASSGGVEALARLVSQLPADFPAAILIVLHRPVERVSHLHEILSRTAKLEVVVAKDGDLLRPGACFIGLPDRHLTVGPDLRVQLLPDGFYRGHNIDALFCSLAQHAGRRTIGVVLTGLRKDGVYGLRSIKQAGGAALVQSPEEAEYKEMPLAAIENDGPIDLVAPLDLIAKKILALTGCQQAPAALCVLPKPATAAKQ